MPSDSSLTLSQRRAIVHPPRRDMQQLFIIGAGGFGREVLEWALAMPAAGRDWQVAGFLDDYADALKGHDLPVSMVGTPGEHAVRSNHLFICALGDPRQRVAYATSMRQRGGQFINIIHPLQHTSISSINKATILRMHIHKSA